MIENSVNIKYKDEPVLLDRALQDIQKMLLMKLTWLDFAFGRSYRLVEREPNGRKFIYPAVYKGNGDYISLLPNDNFGNFSWFEIYDPQKITNTTPMSPRYTVDGAIVFWYNLSSIYGDDTVLHTEEIKNEILKALTTPGSIKASGRLVINNIYEQLENIYKDYSIENVSDNYMMYPYAGIRIEFTLTVEELCQRFM